MAVAQDWLASSGLLAIVLMLLPAAAFSCVAHCTGAEPASAVGCSSRSCCFAQTVTPSRPPPVVSCSAASQSARAAAGCSLSRWQAALLDKAAVLSAVAGACCSSKVYASAAPLEILQECSALSHQCFTICE